MKKSIAALGFAIGLVSFGQTAHAATCSVADVTGAQACVGYFSANLLNNSGSHFSDQVDALKMLGLNFGGSWQQVDLTKVSISGNTINFKTPLNGISYIGIKKGNGRGGYSGTAFYRIEANNLSSLQYALTGGSSAVIYATNQTVPLPEPATWAMMIVGFGAVAAAMRGKARKGFGAPRLV